MHLTDEVAWAKYDFLAAGLLLLVTGAAADRIICTVKTKRRKVAALSILAATFLLVWAQLAVGIV
jgi:heme A synthase